MRRPPSLPWLVAAALLGFAVGRFWSPRGWDPPTAPAAESDAAVRAMVEQAAERALPLPVLEPADPSPSPATDPVAAPSPSS